MSARPHLGQVVEYLVLNYDTVLEDALALERIPLLMEWMGA